MTRRLLAIALAACLATRAVAGGREPFVRGTLAASTDGLGARVYVVHIPVAPRLPASVDCQVVCGVGVREADLRRLAGREVVVVGETGRRGDRLFVLARKVAPARKE